MIPHIEDLSKSKLALLLTNIEQYSAYEKIDGSQILFGIDEIGFYTSRETKGGQRIYHINEYAINFSTSYMRAAHSALCKHLHILTRILQPNDQIEAEVVYGVLPNVVPYDTTVNHIVFLRNTSGNTDLKKLQLLLKNTTITLDIPYTVDGRQIAQHTEKSKWKFAVVKPRHFKKLPDDIIEKSIADIKHTLLHNCISISCSQFGNSNSSWIEGVVLRHNIAGEQVKIIDKTVFTAVKDFYWSVRNSLSHIPHNLSTVDSFIGELSVNLSESIGHPLLGTRQAKRYLANIAGCPLIHIATNLEFSIIKAQWGKILADANYDLENRLAEYNFNKGTLTLHTTIGNQLHTFTYNSEVDKRTKQVFAEMFLKIGKIKQDINNAGNIEELLMILIGKHII